ncbi:MAG TPA: sugar transferase [Armatimonadetes bacterium]|nr:sugar transferase [Armatimonadota bacterium]
MSTKATDRATMLNTPPAACTTSVDVTYERLKRVLDVIIAFTLLAMFLPLWLFIALFIKLTSKGPVFYTSTVVGKGGKPFTYYKFRTMYANNDPTIHARFIEQFVRKNRPFTEVQGKGGSRRPVYKVINDPRVTPFGRLLRKTSLDEIPQMFNVLRGEMSIVGPRPPVWHEYQLYTDYCKRRLAVQPGITGLYQVKARNQVPFAEMLRIDLEYIRQRSFALDLWIILRTFLVVATGEGAE